MSVDRATKISVFSYYYLCNSWCQGMCFSLQVSTLRNDDHVNKWNILWQRDQNEIWDEESFPHHLIKVQKYGHFLSWLGQSGGSVAGTGRLVRNKGRMNVAISWKFLKKIYFGAHEIWHVIFHFSTWQLPYKPTTKFANHVFNLPLGVIQCHFVQF